MRVVTTIEFSMKMALDHQDDVDKKRLYDDLYHEVFQLFCVEETYHVDTFLNGFEDVMEVMKFTGLMAEFGHNFGMFPLPPKVELVEDDAKTYHFVYEEDPKLTEHIVVLAIILHTYFTHREIAEFFGSLMYRIISIIDQMDQDLFLMGGV